MAVAVNSARREPDPSGRLRRPGQPDLLRELADLSSASLQIDLHAPPGPQLADLLLKIFDFEAVAIFDADLHEVCCRGAWSADPSEVVQNVYHFGTSDDDLEKGISRRVIRLGAVPIGGLLLVGDVTPVLSDALASLLALTFDRYRATANEIRVEAEREAEQMRAAVLDNLAHAYKTPLTAIRAASGGLAEMRGLSAAQAELVSIIDEQAALLNDLTNRLLTTARLDSGYSAAAGLIRTERVSIASLLEEGIASLAGRAGSGRIAVELPDDALAVECDRRLMTMLLTQYLDNACKYSDPGRPIVLAAYPRPDEAEVVFSVHSFGPVIPMADRERIFDRYFRSVPSEQRAPGTGIGLSIAKRAAQAHGGAVWVSSDAAAGTVFFAAIPATQQASRPNAVRASSTGH